MTNRRTLTFSIFAAAVLALCLPVLAAAQGGYGYPDYGRNRDDNYRRDRNDDSGRYDQRYLKDSINRLDRLARDFQRELDRDLDHSRENGSRHEDRVNSEGRDFRNAVSNLKSNFNSRDLNRSYDEAQQVLREANRTERATQHHFDNSRIADDWSQIQDELQVIADAYGISYRGGYNNGGYYPNDRNNRNDDYGRNNPNNNRNRNNDWWRRIPWPN